MANYKDVAENFGIHKTPICILQHTHMFVVALVTWSFVSQDTYYNDIRCTFRKSKPVLAMINLLSHLTLAAMSFLYKPETGSIWDPSCFRIRNGTFYCVFMYSPTFKSGSTSGFLATSEDGVHWRDVGPIAPAVNGTKWYPTTYIYAE